MLRSLLSLLILILITAYESNSQIILTAEDIEINHDSVYHLQPLSDLSRLTPEEGDDILWAYYNVNFDSEVQEFSFTELPKEPAFPDADFISQSTYYEINATYYTKVDDSGRRILGAYIPETGRIIDAEKNIYIRIPEQISEFEPAVTQLSFPLEYGNVYQQDDWSYRETEFVLNVPGLYEEAEGRIIERRDVMYEINGWGELLLPGYEEPIEVLMIRSELTVVDSVYLNGQPADPQALTLLGLNQGSIAFSDNILFMCKEYPLPVLTLNIDQAGEVYSGTIVKNPSMAQNSIEITSEDFGKNATAEYHLRDLEETDFNIETEAKGHYWNVSGLTGKGQPYPERYWQAGENPPLEDASLMARKDIRFSNSGFEIEAEQYFTLWNTALQYLGNKYNAESIFFDEDETVLVEIPQQVSHNSLSLPVYSFPMFYGREKVMNTANRSLDFMITAPGYFNEAPGQLKTYETLRNEIIAWGEVYLPDHSEPVSVVVNKRTKTLVDSVFIEKNPASEDFLQEIGLHQGNSTTTVTYEFMAKDFSHPVMEIFADESGEIYLARYITGEPLSVAEFNDESKIMVFPNPALSSALKIKLTEDIISGKIIIYDRAGRKKSTNMLSAAGGYIYEINLDDSMKNGVYYFKIVDNAKIIHTGKFILMK